MGDVKIKVFEIQMKTGAVKTFFLSNTARSQDQNLGLLPPNQP